MNLKFHNLTLPEAIDMALNNCSGDSRLRAHS